MKILFKQQTDSGVLTAHGIKDCFLKHITDSDRPTLKGHHHNGFEIHFIKSGHASYISDNTEYSADTGVAVIIPPSVEHRPLSVSCGTEKFALTFSAAEGARLDFSEYGSVSVRDISKTVSESLLYIQNLYNEKNPLFGALAENRIFELIALFLKPKLTNCDTEAFENSEGLRIRLAKQFIADNVLQNLSVSDVAVYCHLSTKQLSRLFVSAVGVTPHTFIANERTEVIKRLLEADELSLREISEKTGFNNEYYFNSFFKKHSGITPLCYRKMHR